MPGPSSWNVGQSSSASGRPAHSGSAGNRSRGRAARARGWRARSTPAASLARAPDPVVEPSALSRSPARSSPSAMKAPSRNHEKPYSRPEGGAGHERAAGGLSGADHLQARRRRLIRCLQDRAVIRSSLRSSHEAAADELPLQHHEDDQHRRQRDQRSREQRRPHSVAWDAGADGCRSAACRAPGSRVVIAQVNSSQAASQRKIVTVARPGFERQCDGPERPQTPGPVHLRRVEELLRHRREEPTQQERIQPQVHHRVDGHESPQVLSSPRSRASTNWGMSSTIPGTIMVNSSTPKRMRRPGSRSAQTQSRASPRATPRSRSARRHQHRVEEVAREVAARPGASDVVERRRLRDEPRRDLKHVRVGLEGGGDHGGEWQDHHDPESNAS